MSRKLVLTTILLLCALPPLMLGEYIIRADTQYPHLTDLESQVVSLVNGTSTYDYDLELERIALDHSLSDYAFRSAGSPGANQTANWIKSQFESIGLTETHLEPFEFTTWNLPTKPTLASDEDGNAGTTGDQVLIESFQPAHFSWPTNGSIFSDLVVLPLPENVSYSQFDVGQLPNYNASAWIQINTAGKILLIGREINWYPPWRRVFESKISSQPPALLVYTWWYDWMAFTPSFFGSMSGHTWWDSELPVGFVNYYDGLWMRNREKNVNVSATVNIPATIGVGTHYNVVGKLRGKTDPDKYIIISGHYDTVMDAGFCDNGAGTAGVIELARVFTEAVRNGVYTPDQTLVFIGFTGEELGFVGAINYIRQHKADVKNISAVINLDCIGHNNLTVSETFPDEKGLELDEIVLRAARDLSVNASSEDHGGSDQEAFRNPIQASSYYIDDWKLSADINDTARVKSSTMLCSTPLFYSDRLKGGEAGWIHSEYDNSTSTVTLGWVKTEDLEAHLKVAALSVMRVLAALYNPFMSQVLMGTGVVFIVLAVVVFLERSKVKTALVKLYAHITDYIEAREWVFALVIAAFLLFSSYASYTRIGKIEVIVKGVPTVATMRFYGYPFEMLGFPLQISITGQDLEFVTTQLAMNPESNTPQVLLVGLLLNTALFFAIAFLITYLATRLRYAIIPRKSPETA